MPVLDKCPDNATIEHYLSGTLQSFKVDALESHALHCERCAFHVATMANQDDLLQYWGRQSPILESTDELALENALRGISALRPTVSHQLTDEPSLVPSDATTAIGSYSIVRQLGQGGMGIVFEAEDPRLHRRVALKVLHHHRASNDVYRSRFLREADALARLAHPNIVPVYEVGEHEGRPYLAMELVHGGSLDRHLIGTPLPPRDAAELLIKICRGVAHAHGLGITHRDLKPGNVLLSPVSTASSFQGLAEMVPRVADFGLAGMDDADTLTQTGDLLGTPSYMAPEATTGQSPKDSSTSIDIYALGAILYELLTGRPPFRGQTAIDTLQQVRTLEPVTPRRLQPTVPRDLEAVCLKCLEKSPNRRYVSATSLEADLDRYLRGQPVLARHPSWLGRSWKWAKRNPAWALLTLGAIVAVAIASVGVAAYERSLRQALAAAQQRADEARQEREHAQRNYREARATIARIVSRTNEEGRADLPRVRELRRQQQEDALEFYLNMAGNADAIGPEIRWDIARARVDAGHLQLVLGQAQAAEANLSLAITALDELIAEAPSQHQYRQALAASLADRANLPGKATAAARIDLQRALQEIKQVAKDSADPVVMSEIARMHHNLGNLSIFDSDWVTAESHLQQAMAIRRQLLAVAPSTSQRLALAQTEINWLFVRQQVGATFAQLEPNVQAVQAVLSDLIRQLPGDPGPVVALSGLNVNWAYMQLSANRPGEALTSLDESVTQLEKFLATEPNWDEGKSKLYSAYGTRAIVLDRIGKPAAAARDYQKLIPLAPTTSRRDLTNDLISLLIAARDHSSAIDEANRITMASHPWTEPAVLIQFLKHCRTLSSQSSWSIARCRIQAIARAAIETAAKSVPADQWPAWKQALKLAGDLG